MVRQLGSTIVPNIIVKNGEIKEKKKRKRNFLDSNLAFAERGERPDLRSINGSLASARCKFVDRYVRGTRFNLGFIEEREKVARHGQAV